jgi:hypothetical protein
MKKSSFSLLAVAMFCMCMSACEKQNPEPKPQQKAPEVKQEYLNANPEGQADLTYAVSIVKDWTDSTWSIAAEEKYDWIEVSPKNAKGNATVTFTVTANQTDKERSAIFDVTAGEYKTCEIMISQAKMESNVSEDDLDFLKAIVEGKMLGESTPSIDNWYEVDPGAFPGINMVDKDGKLYIEKLDGAPLTDFPVKMHLSELTDIMVTDDVALVGKRLPVDWDTPKLVFIDLKNDKLTGPVPDGLAASPALVEIYCDGCNFFGALPHDWSSKTLKVVLFANYGTPKDAADPTITEDNPGLGYIIPASLDVLLNNYDASGNLDNSPMHWHDKTQFKIGGVKEQTWLGFEKGWGQVRYEKYDADAVSGDLATWSDHRLLYDDWAWYFSNIGYPERAGGVPKVMLEWDQTAADAYTAKCEAAAKSN